MLVSPIMALDACIIVRDFGTQKFVIELTESEADYCRVSVSVAKLGQSGRSFAFKYLFIYLFIHLFILDINSHWN